jgi:hypothetical protein
MYSHLSNTRGAGSGVACCAVLCVASLAGCCGGILPSARIFPSAPPLAVATPAVAGPAANSECLVPHAAANSECLIPPAGYCGADACPPLFAWRGARLLHGFGPLFYRGDEGEQQMTEAELYPPHSRFHPVPTAPVFAPRPEYDPPEQMMEPVPAKPHLAPRAALRAPRPLDLSSPKIGGPALEPVPAGQPENRGEPAANPAEPTHEPGYDAKASREPHSVLLLNR